MLYSSLYISLLCAILVCTEEGLKDISYPRSDFECESIHISDYQCLILAVTHASYNLYCVLSVSSQCHQCAYNNYIYVTLQELIILSGITDEQLHKGQKFCCLAGCWKLHVDC